MGQFSWISADTREAIRNNIPKGRQKVTMVFLDPHGVEQRVVEDDYDGYGIFGGFDFYEVLSWMNPNQTKNSERVLHTRDRGISLYFGGGDHKSPQLFLGKPPEVVNFDNRMEDDPNQGWGDDDEDDFFDFYHDDYNEDDDY